MSISVLDTYATATRSTRTQLPCRRENPELFFAESPQRRGARQGAVPGLPGPGRVPGRSPRAARAVGRLGR